MNVVLYARVSTGKQAERDLSIPSQIKEMEAYCKVKGWTIVDIYREEGASGRDETRPVFQGMIYEATKSSHPIDAIVTITTSRFFRNATQARVYKHMLAKSGVSVIAIKQEVTDDPMGNVIEGIFELIDQYESEINALHTKRAMLENARQGNHNGAPPPYGYTVIETPDKKKRLVVNEHEAAVVTKIYNYYLGGTGKSIGIKAIAARLNSECETCRGKAWKKGMVHAILTRIAYTGKAFYNRKDGKSREIKPTNEWIEVAVPRIIDDETFNAAQERMGRRSFDNADAKRKDNPTLLTGLLKCKCGAAMSLMTGKGGRYRYYRCIRRTNIDNQVCDAPNIPVDEMDALVLDTLKHMIFNPARIRNILAELQKAFSGGQDDSDSVRRKLTKELSDVKSQLIRLCMLFEQDVLPLETLQERSAALTMKQHTLQQQLDELLQRSKLLPQEIGSKALAAFCKHVSSMFEEAKNGFAKEYLKLFVHEIVVNDRKVTITGNADNMASYLEKKSAYNGLTTGAINNQAGHFLKSRNAQPFFVSAY